MASAQQYNNTTIQQFSNIKNIAILGSTGSIGTQALEVIGENPSLFNAYVITAQNNAELLIQQALKFHPAYAIICNEKYYNRVKEALASTNVKVLAGIQSINEIVTDPKIDMVLTAMVGFAGLEPTINAIKAGKNIALANKETLVVAGELITALARQHQVSILPVDSEHSAIFQCLEGEDVNTIEKLIITASGGPFRGKNLEFLDNVTPEAALKHPNWVMGAKVTIDSASLMNKGLEVIEAKWLFDIEPDKIEVLVHPQSIIHSMVQFHDGSVKAQMGPHDMRLPIQYALAYPSRIKNNFKRLDFTRHASLTFEKPDTKTFRNLALAFAAIKQGGNMPCIVNAANEIAVAGFLNGGIGFVTMSDVIESCMQQIAFKSDPALDDYLNTDRETRIFAQNLIEKIPLRTFTN